MTDGDKVGLIAAWPEIVRKIRARTPARLLQGCAGAAYLTHTQLDLRAAHAAARDAVRTEFDARAIFGEGFWKAWRLVETSTRARTKDQYLRYPDLGRHFDEASRAEIARGCAPHTRLQIAIGDGLSVPALSAQIPALLPALHAAAIRRGWTVGQTFVIRHCRVGILNEIGELLAPDVAVLLIGERPGLATVESLSANIAYRPDASHTDANRNLISNIHARGCKPGKRPKESWNLPSG
ncbi:MAG TPA: ethanolamine ammonia-lyase light chain EutC [Candidatus Dormibacteraeota bacterium]|nr:ethanolamine ammonia-lyase light chain EutC [Candidatus Dormibacteraeota bacterium]